MPGISTPPAVIDTSMLTTPEKNAVQLVEYARFIRNSASLPILLDSSSVNLADLLKQYSSIKPIPAVSDFFALLPDNRRLLLLVFLYGAGNLAVHLSANLAWRARDNMHVFAALTLMHETISRISEYTKGIKAQILFTGDTINQCNYDLLQLAKLTMPKEPCSVPDLAKSVALSIPSIYLYTALRKCLHYTLQSAVNSFVVSHEKADAVVKSFGRLWDSMVQHLLSTPPRKRRRFVTPKVKM